MLKLLKHKISSLISDKKFSEILTGSVWALGARVVATGLGMVTSIIIARAYGAEVLGIVAMLNSFLMLATIFTVLGTNTSILRLIPEHISKYSALSAFKVYRKTQYFVAGISLITGSILFLGSEYIANTVFAKPNLRFYFALGALFIFFESLMILNTQALRGLRLIREFAFMQFLPQLSKLAILLLLTIFFFDMDNPVYAMFASIGVTALVGAWIMDRAFKKRIQERDTIQPMLIRHILSLSLPMLMTATMTFVIGQTGVIILGVFRSEAEVGNYAVAVKLATLTGFILNSINSMAAPRFSELFHSGKMDELFHVARKATKLIFWTTAPILLFLIFFGKPLLYLLFGSNFLAAYGSMVPLVIGQFVHSISGSTAIFMNMTGSQKWLRNFIIISAVVNITFNLLLIPSFGIVGAALAGMTSIILWNVCSLVYISSKYGKSIGYLPFWSH